ncbi:MAG: response regulator [Leptolyngbyaceae bacterium]|nr:response regulator [Leptolyngbyaceae bacterium]
MKKILIIEDSEDVRDSIVSILEAEHYQTFSADNGELGVRLAQEQSPDLIICDIMMPVLDGYGVLHTLHQDLQTAAIPFIFLTAKASQADLRQGMNLGADDYLVKPFSHSELLGAIATRLAKQEVLEKQSQQKLAELTSSAQREELLNRLTRLIRNSLEFKIILSTTLTEIRNLLQVHRCRFFWFRSDVSTPYFELIYEASDPSFAHILQNPFEEIPRLGDQILQQHLIRIDDLGTETQLDPSSCAHLMSLGFKSVLALLIQTRSQQMGVLLCTHFEQPRPWSNNEVQLLQAVADQLAIAIDQAELYTRSNFAATTAQIQAQQLGKALAELKATQAQLIQNEKMLSLGQLVAGVAHEINNPVNFIYGNVKYARSYTQEVLNLLQRYQEEYPTPSQALQDQADAIDLAFIKEDLLKIFASMEMGTERIRQIVLSLRNFSRLDESEMKPVDIHEGMDSTLLILQSRLKGSLVTGNIQVVKQYGELPLVNCYAGQLNQVFMNILANAIDALREAEAEPSPAVPLNQPGTITIKTALSDSNQVTISIHDNGPGMPESVRKRLFDPFFTTKPVGQGTGLGLSISYQIVVEKHRGTLECISVAGQGTEFLIKIPV